MVCHTADCHQSQPSEITGETLISAQRACGPALSGSGTAYRARCEPGRAQNKPSGRGRGTCSTGAKRKEISVMDSYFIANFRPAETPGAGFFSGEK